MDHSARTEALKIAKSLISSHGIAVNMNKYNRNMLARTIDDEMSCIRYDFHLDPEKDSWHSSNPSCTLSVIYNSDAKGSRVAENGDVVVDSYMRLGVSASASDMDIPTLKKRESMLTMLTMLCEMLHASLPPIVTSIVMTSEESKAKKQREFEQTVAYQIAQNIGPDTLTGLRRNGNSKFKRMSEDYLKSNERYPSSGTYRYRHIRRTDSRGRVREEAAYVFRVSGGDGPLPPSIAIRRVDIDAIK